MSTTIRTITVGWTRHDLDRRNSLDYAPFLDTYRPGQPQHTEVLTLDLPTDLTVEQITEAVFVATNAPRDILADGSPEAKIAAAIDATGYRGEGAHYSLSIGDTVTEGSVVVGIARRGTVRIEGSL